MGADEIDLTLPKDTFPMHLLVINNLAILFLETSLVFHNTYDTPLSVRQETYLLNYSVYYKRSHVIKSIKCVKLYSTFYISYTIRTNGLLYLTGHNECPLLTILLT